MTQRERRTLLRALLLTAMLAAMFAGGPAPRLLAKGGGLPRAERLNAAPTPSGAEAAYPLNHIFDASGDAAGTPPPNHDFEAAGSTVGTPPANHDFSSPSTDAGTPPANHTFEATPDFAGWTASGTTSIQSDSTRGRWAKLGGSGTLTSSTFTIEPAAQAFVFDVGWLPSGWSYLRIHALTGPDFSTSTELKYMSGSGSQWRSVALDATAYRGQTIKLKFTREGGEVGIDNVRTQVVFPQWEATGEFSRQTEAGGNAYAELTGGAVISSAFTVDAAAQTGTVRIKGLTTGSDQYYVYVLSGPTFATSTRMPGYSVGDEWTPIAFSLSPYQGQTIKLKVERQTGRIAVDDVGGAAITVPQWHVTGDTRLETGGPTGNYISTNGEVTSSAFQLGANVQQITLLHKGVENNGLFYFELLRGAEFSQVVDLAGAVTADASQWQTLKVAVSQYAGETVKVRVRRYNGRILIDRVGGGESTLPGWTPVGTNPVVTGEDAYGTYITTVSSSQAINVRSSSIQSGVLDGPAANDARYFAISYDIGSVASDLVRVAWTNSVGEWWVVFQKAASTPTGYRTGYFPVYDWMGQTGTLSVNIAGKGKVYSIADNIARQQLAEPFSQKVGATIDTSTGSFGFEERDLATVGSLPLVLTRYYVGQSDRLGPLGYRWSHSFETRLVVTDDNDAGVVFGNGSEAFFDWNSNSSSFIAADPRVKDKLAKNPDGSYTFTTTKNLAYRFAADGRLTSITDLNGNAITLGYDGSGRLTTATAPGNQSFTFGYTAQGRLATVTDPTGAVVTYGYDAAGDLVSARDPEGGTRTYTYDKHRLTKVTDKNGGTLFTNALDAVNRVTSQTDAANKTLRIAYDAPAKGATQVTDPLNNTATYYFDGFHRTTAKTDPTGRTVSYAYDQSGNLFTLTDPGSNTWSFAYDASGNPTTVTDPLNQPLEMTWTAQNLPRTVKDKRGNVTALVYDAAGNVTQKTDALGKVWSYTYDARGNQLAETNPLGQTTTSTYDTANRRLSRTDALNNTWRWTYDAAGRVLTETNPLNQTTTYAYDSTGRLLTETNALNQTSSYEYDALGALVKVTDPAGATTSYAYDSRGLNTSKTDPAGKVTTYGWDAARRLSTITDPLGRVTRYTYDEASRLASTTDPTNAATRFTYDSAGRVATETDPLNRTTTYTYDRAGKVTSVTAPNGGVTAFTYDADGNLTRRADGLNKVTVFEYDALSRRTKTTDPLLNSTAFGYDAAGRLTSTTNALNQTTSYAYDAAGRRTGVTNPLNQTTTYGYDAVGRQTSVTDPLSRTTTSVYDALGRVTSVTGPDGTPATTTYDAAGRVTRHARPSGAATSYTYDPRGLLLTETDPLNRVTRYTYDDAGQQVSVTDPRNAVTTYTYDGAGRQTSIADHLQGTVRFGYDAAGQQTSVTNARGKTTSFTYDAVGNLLTQTDPLNRTTTHTYDTLSRLTRTTDPRGVVIDYGYDAADQLTSTNYPGGSIRYTYDTAGRRTGVTDATGTTTTHYDAAGRTVAVVSPQGTVGYDFNAAGQRTSMTLPGNRTVQYSYDTAGRLTNLTDWQGGTTRFDYDADGRRTTTTRPNGVVTTNTYDAAGQLGSVVHAKGTTTLKSFSYTYDPAGNRTGVSGSGGTESYTLDLLGRLTSVTYGNGEVMSYTYDANGNRTSVTAGGTITTSAYDDADQLLTEGTVRYTHDAAGNVTARGTDGFTWDWRNRLTSATVDGATATYVYDGEDVRVRKTVDTTTTTYIWDRESGLPLLVDDGTNGYVHADGVQQQIAADGATRTLLGDGLGSVRGSATGSGTLTGSTDYDVFGSVRGTSTVGSVFGFTGEQHDGETGFLHLRAREYDPTSGRFLSADTVQPNAPGTQGYNLYAYVANNPTTWTDPSGHAATAPQRFTAVELRVASRIGAVAACLQTGWCAPNLVMGVALVFGQPSVLPQWAGFAITTFTLVGCLMDVKVEQGPGPQGLHFGDGDSCFKVFTQTQNVPDCHFRPAESCIPAPPGPGGPDKPTDRERECLPQGRTGPYKVYVGLDKESGELTYVGITMQDLRVRERKHNSGQGIKRNIELVGVGLGYSEELAGAIERYLWERLKDEGYRLTNSPMRPQPWDPCYGYLMQAAGEVVERERLLEKAHSARRRPSK